MTGSVHRVSTAARPVDARRSSRHSGATAEISGQRTVATKHDVKTKMRVWAMEAADAVDERNGPLAHSVLENATRFPQLPQPETSRVSQTTQTRAGLSLAELLGGLAHLAQLTLRIGPFGGCRVL
jgi:hypothetical protein